MAQLINAEHNEIVLTSEAKSVKGEASPNKTTVIIPAKNKEEIEGYLANNQHDKITEFVSKLPMADDYAAEGGIIPGIDDDSSPVKVKENVDDSLVNLIPDTSKPIVDPLLEEIAKLEQGEQTPDVAIQLEALYKKKKEWQGSVEYDKFYKANRLVKTYGLAHKGYKDNTKMDCSGGVCRYRGYGRNIADYTGSGNFKDAAITNYTQATSKDGTLVYMKNKSGGVAHTGIVTVDKYGNKRFVSVNSKDNGVGDEDLDAYVKRLDDKYEFSYFDIDESKITGRIDKYYKSVKSTKRADTNFEYDYGEETVVDKPIPVPKSSSSEPTPSKTNKPKSNSSSSSGTARVETKPIITNKPTNKPKRNVAVTPKSTVVVLKGGKVKRPIGSSPRVSNSERVIKPKNIIR